MDCQEAQGVENHVRNEPTFTTTSPRFLGAAGFGLLHTIGAHGETLPPTRTITRGPRHHWFAYYDKLQFSPDDRYVLSNEVDFEHRTPTADDRIRVGMVDTANNDEWIELGSSLAWGWQQGCMLQWIPKTQADVLWNDREGDHFVCHIMNTKTREQRTLDRPIYTISPDGRYGLSVNFARSASASSRIWLCRVARSLRRGAGAGRRWRLSRLTSNPERRN